MAANKPTKSKTAVSKRLVRELTTILKDRKDIEVVGHIDAPAYCCGNGTVALVKIDKGDRVR